MQRNDDTTGWDKVDAVDLDDPRLRRMEGYWSSLRRARNLPARAAIDPAKIEDVLPFAFILQRVAAGTARFRVAGQRVHDLLKMDPRGMPFSTLFHADARDDIRDLTEAAFSDPAIVGLPLMAPGSLLRPALPGAMLLLPMEDGQGRTTRLLGALITPQHQPNRARRFLLRPGARSRYMALGAERPVTVLHPKPPSRTQGPERNQRPALRLVVNNG